MKIALYKNGCLVAVVENVTNVLHFQDGSIEVLTKEVNGTESRIDYHKTDYDMFEVWR